MSAFKEMSNLRFGKLTVVRYIMGVKKFNGTAHYWFCKCDCGNETLSEARPLKTGRITSCGCLPRRGIGNLRHGRTKTSEYNIWSMMKRRCLDPKTPNFGDYGGRGITICERWLIPKVGFENFYNDMGPRPSKDFSLDRIDNNKGYFPENCRWATRTQQARNRRNNYIITAFGKSAPMGEFVGTDPLIYSRVKNRLNSGWPAELALTAEKGVRRAE